MTFVLQDILLNVDVNLDHMFILSLVYDIAKVSVRYRKVKCRYISISLEVLNARISFTENDVSNE